MSRKRQHNQDVSETAGRTSPKRRTSGTQHGISEDADPRGRAVSPSKGVSWKRTLESGPTKSTADHRNQSPKRPALRHEEEAGRYMNMPEVDALFDDDDGDDDDDDDDSADYTSSEAVSEDDSEQATDPSDQLFLEMENLPTGAGPSGKSGAKKRSATAKANPFINAAATNKKSTAESKIGPARSFSKGKAAERTTPRSLDAMTDEQRELFFLYQLPDIDVYICEQIHELKQHIAGFAEEFTERSLARIPPSFDVLSALFKPSSAKAVRYIGCIGLGGPKGIASWVELLRDFASREALVFGMISRALKETVFNDLWFGGTMKQREELSQLEQSAVDADAFARTEQRAAKCRAFIASGDDTTALMKAIARMMLQLQHLLQPLTNMCGPRRRDISYTGPQLGRIVSCAAHISRTMRLTGNVVYYWPPNFKDEEFDIDQMESRNTKHMIEQSPYRKPSEETLIDADHQYVPPVLQPGNEGRSQAIVRVVCFPGLVAFRQGGGELAKRELKSEGRRVYPVLPPDVQSVQQTRDEKYTGMEGYRTKLISKAVVHLTWGKQRLLTREAGTSLYLDAIRDHSSKYKNDYAGYEELYDLYQVHIATARAAVCRTCGEPGHQARDCRSRSARAEDAVGDNNMRLADVVEKAKGNRR